jgi:Tfp pilus assembly protein PilF
VASDPAGALKFLDAATDKADANVGLQALRISALDALGDQAGVEQVYKKLIALFPQSVAYRLSLAQWYLSKGRTDDAETAMRQYAEDHAADDQAQLGFVSFLNTQKGPQAAIDQLKLAIQTRTQAKADAFSLQMALAQLEFTAGDQAAAVELMSSLNETTSDAKQKNQARVQWARMLVGQQKLADAEKLTDDVISEDAGNADALSVRASIRLMKGDPASAETDILAALNQAPDSAGLHGLLAEAYERDGSVSLAGEQYAKAMDLDHDSPRTGLAYAGFLQRYGQFDQATRALEAVRQKSPNDRAVLTQLAQLKLAAQDWTGAQQIADQLQKLDGSTSDSTVERINAAALTGLNKFDESISILQSALPSATDRPQVLSDLVVAYVKAGKVQAAEDYLKSVVAKNPADIQAQILLGSVYVTDSKPDLAEATFVAAAANDKGVQGAVALAQYYMVLGKLDKAEATAQDALGRQPDSAAARLLLAGVFERAARFEEAISEYETLFKQDPASPIVANDLASLLSERRGDKASLDRAYDIAQRLVGSRIPQYMDTVGWIDHLRGDYASALPLLKSAAEQLPGVALVQYHLGMTLAKLGQASLAKASLEKALAVTPPLDPSDAARVNEALAALNAAPAADGEQKG